jgi:hypothetical protein
VAGQSSHRVAIYARISTINHGQDVGLQTGELREFAEVRGWRLADEYVDRGVSGSKDSRPELNRLLADARKRRFDVVLVWKLDRLGRSLRHLVNVLAEFESLNIAFVSLSDNLDLSTASGRLMFQIIGCSDASWWSSGCKAVSPASGTCPVATVVISGGGAGDQSAGSPDVKVPVGWVKAWSAPTGGRASRQVVSESEP